MMRHVLAPTDLSPKEREAVYATASALKARNTPHDRSGLRVGGLYFNPSLRTRVSWEQAAGVLGGSCQTLNAGADMWKMEMNPSAVMDQDSVENVVEAAGVLGRFFHILGVRSFPQGGTWEEEKQEKVLKAFAEHSGTRIVSLEGAMHHPCQGLADALTLREQFGDLKKLKVTLMWAWHPKHLPMAVPNTFALQTALEGCDLTIVHPEGFDLDPELIEEISSAGSVRVTHDREEGLAEAQAVYVKSWGRISTNTPAPESLRDWIMDDHHWNLTGGAKIMHCLPTRRNVEIASSILDSDRSIVLEEAENRLWAQAGLMHVLLQDQEVLV